MPIFVTVTPGTTVTSSTTLDAATLNLLGTPSVQVEGTVDGGSLSISAGSVLLTSLAAQNDQTVVGNGSGSLASPSALTLSGLTATSTTLSISNSAITTAKIADSSSSTTGVTYAKIQHVADARLLGRSAGSAGVVQELTVGSGLSLSGGTLTNGILRYTTSEKSIPAIGSASQAVQWLTTATELPSLSVAPQIVRVVLKCSTADGPFVAGDELAIESVVMQGYLNNFPIFTYNPVVSAGIVSGSNLFVNVWFTKQYPGNPTPYAAGTSASNLVTLDSTGSYITLTRANWRVKAYLLYASTWA